MIVQEEYISNDSGYLEVLPSKSGCSILVSHDRNDMIPQMSIQLDDEEISWIISQLEPYLPK